MFVWAPIPEPYAEMNSVEFCSMLVHECDVALSPGVGFGPGGEGFARFALIENEQRIAQGIRNLRKGLPNSADADQPRRGRERYVRAWRAPDRSQVRLAELVAALSLGIDLGFGQPMEHVLRQCLIALRLAERLGLDEDERAAVYYTALLVNVGCHTDAHEQAKWFGDDIALKADKYEHELRGLAGAAAACCGCSAPGNPPLHRFRVGLEFALSRPPRPRRHDRAATPRSPRTLAAELGLPEAVLDARSARRTSSGTGRAGRASCAGDDDPDRGAPRAARRVRRGRPSRRRRARRRVALARERARARSSTRRSSTLLRADAETMFADLDAVDDLGRGDRRRAGAPVVLSDDEFDAALAAIADFVDLKSPYTLGHSRAVAELRRGAPARSSGCRATRCATLRRAGLVHDFGRLGVSNAIWDKPRPARRRRVGARPHAPVPHRADAAAVPALAPARRTSPCSTASASTARATRAGSGRAISRPGRILAAADAYQAMLEPRRTARRARPTSRRRAARRGAGRPARRRRGRAVLAAAGPSRPAPAAQARPG